MAGHAIAGITRPVRLEDMPLVGVIPDEQFQFADHELRQRRYVVT